MKAPTHLGHFPIVVINDYNVIDEKVTGDTDAEALSIGLAQYNRNDISAKIFRHTGNMWSRQSEEMPLHRVLDLANLIVEAMLICQNKGSNSQISVNSSSDLGKLKQYFEENTDNLEPRLRELKDTINKLL